MSELTAEETLDRAHRKAQVWLRNLVANRNHIEGRVPVHMDTRILDHMDFLELVGGEGDPEYIEARDVIRAAMFNDAKEED